MHGICWPLSLNWQTADEGEDAFWKELLTQSRSFFLRRSEFLCVVIFSLMDWQTVELGGGGDAVNPGQRCLLCGVCVVWSGKAWYSWQMFYRMNCALLAVRQNRWHMSTD